MDVKDGGGLTPEAAGLLAGLRTQGFPGWAFLTVPQTRAMMTGLKALAGDAGFDGTAEDVRISEVPEITARVYRPRSSATPPVLVYLHGGGFCAGDAECYDGTVRWLARASEHAIVSVNYRLAPEHRFPAALDDSYAAVRWAYDNAALLGWDADRLAVGGDSAGANLAAAVCLLARERQGPPIAKQLLVSPVVDHALETDSCRQHGAEGALTLRDVAWFQSHYFGDRADRLDALASPLRAADLSGLPPAVIVAAAVDPLHDDAVGYAEKLREAGVDVKLRVFPGMFHGFWVAAGVLPETRAAIAFAAEGLNG